MNNSGIEARRAYKRAWAKAHPDLIRAEQKRYWEKRGAQATNAEDAAGARVTAAVTAD
jgi:hypothetical protein